MTDENLKSSSSGKVEDLAQLTTARHASAQWSTPSRSVSRASLVEGIRREYETIVPLAVRLWISEGFAPAKGPCHFHPPEAAYLCVAAIKLKSWEDAGIASEFPCTLPRSDQLFKIWRAIADKKLRFRVEGVEQRILCAALCLAGYVLDAWFDHAAMKPLGVNADCVLHINIDAQRFLESLCDFFLALPNGDANLFNCEDQHEQ